MNRVFISYVKENMEMVDRLCEELKAQRIEVWRDRDNIDPGLRWKREIRLAIQNGAFFIGCFSKEYDERNQTYMNEELTIAIAELRQRPHDRIWFIPVKLNKCEIPDCDIGGSATLRDLQYVDLSEDCDSGIQQITKVIRTMVPDPAIDANGNESREDHDAEEEYSKGLKCQNSASGTTSPERQQEKFEKALQHYSRALQLKPKYVNAWNARGFIYCMVGKIDDALQNFSMAIKLQPDFFVAYLNRGGVHKSDGRYKQALQDFGKVIELRPDVYAGYFNRGDIYRLKGDFDRAIVDYNAAIKLKPELGDIYNNRGVAYVNKGNYQRAIVDFTEAIALDPDLAAAYFNRGVTQMRLSEWEEARSDLKVAKGMGINVVSVFHQDFEDVSDFERRNGVKVPQNIAAIFTQPTG